MKSSGVAAPPWRRGGQRRSGADRGGWLGGWQQLSCGRRQSRHSWQRSGEWASGPLLEYQLAHHAEDRPANVPKRVATSVASCAAALGPRERGEAQTKARRESVEGARERGARGCRPRCPRGCEEPLLDCLAPPCQQPARVNRSLSTTQLKSNSTFG